ncbi:MAG: TrpB-like pyridoxal phosphate-dependent enzyme [Eubacteriales bacterium]|nr:TrpB-like pyridoxal phosphate-dependent enzyme [Eubacteriales bacterium]
MANIPYKIYLSENEMPQFWMNLQAYLPKKLDPMLDPKTGRPVTEEGLRAVFTDEAVRQELNTTDKLIEIPQPILDFYRMYRPSPVVRAYNLEKMLDTPAELYYKFEGTNTSGSHKLNSAVPQVYYAREQGLTNVTTETGAGQWGTALAMATGYYGLGLKVFMVKSSAEQKPHRKAVMETYGGTVIPSPSDTTAVGRKILQEHPGTGGSLGCAISEAVEVALNQEGTRYLLGSVLNHVLLHQSVIGLEAKAALDKYNITPDVVIGCTGGGSNFGGLIAPYMADRLEGKNNIRFVAVEPASCPTLTRGRFAYDYGDTGRMTPLMKMYTLGSGFIPSSNHAGGLRYHGMNPIISQLRHDGLVDAVAYEQTRVFRAAKIFCKSEGNLPAPESNHALCAAMDEAIRCKETGEKKKILFCLTGTGFFDMPAYMLYNSGKMTDSIPTDEELEQGFATLPEINL